MKRVRREHPGELRFQRLTKLYSILAQRPIDGKSSCTLFGDIVNDGSRSIQSAYAYPHQAVYALANWPMDVPEKSPADQPELFPRVLHDTAAGYFIFRNGWSDAGQDICVSALLGTHPTHQNGRGMASGGSIYVYGKGLGWAGDRAGYRFPGIF